MHTGVGWTLAGPGTGGSINVHANFVRRDNDELHEQTKTFLNHEFRDGTCPSDIALSVENKQALAQMEESEVKIGDHYQVALPWRPKNVVLPNNREYAIKRLVGLKRKLSRDPEYFSNYEKKINGYLESGHARRIPLENQASSERTWYLLHHATGGKFWVVFDCSAWFRDTSLNQELLF